MKKALSNQLCKCGCGEYTYISPITSKRNGYVAGKPRDYCSYHSMRGKLPKNKVGGWNRGKKMSLDWRKKLSEAKLRNPVRYWKGSFGQRTGKDAPNWQGGKTSERDRLRKSLEYKLWRTSVFERDNFTCVFCKIRGGKLEADHIKPWCNYPELRFAIDNGRTLCHDCHTKTDTYLMITGRNQYTKTKEKA